jgi:hypothetical protein
VIDTVVIHEQRAGGAHASSIPGEMKSTIPLSRVIRAGESITQRRIKQKKVLRQQEDHTHECGYHEEEHWNCNYTFLSIPYRKTAIRLSCTLAQSTGRNNPNYQDNVRHGSTR